MKAFNLLNRGRKSVRLLLDQLRLPVTAQAVCLQGTYQANRTGEKTTQEYHMIDLISDTVTRPSPAMYQAMIRAPVGDDVLKEDPTILELQRRCAQMFNKEDSLFTPSGTMSNLLSVMTHCDRRGQEVIVGKLNDIFMFEAGGLSQIAGVHVNAIINAEDGTLDLNEVEQNIRNPVDDHVPQTRVICVENSQNRRGGVVLPVSYFKELRRLADEHGLAVHLDGARLMNACIAADVEPWEFTDHVDSVSMCFSKGLGAPVGSILAGSADFCRRARRSRKALGGGMRQAGVLAAAALYALDNNVQRMKEDHEKTRQISKVVAEHGGNVAKVYMDKLKTNIGFIHLSDVNKLNAKQFKERLAEVTDEELMILGKKISIRVLAATKDSVRFITHINTTAEEVALATEKIKYVLAEQNQQLIQNKILI